MGLVGSVNREGQVLKYSRTIPRAEYSIGLAQEIEAQIRAHLSACASDTDSEQEFAGEVDVSQAALDNGDIRILGYLNRAKSSYGPDASGYAFTPWTPA